VGRSGIIRKKGKGETRVEKMRWRRKMMKFGKIIAGWVELACHQKTSTYHS